MMRALLATLALLLLIPAPAARARPGGAPAAAPEALLPAGPGTTWIYAGERVTCDGENQKEIRAEAANVVTLEKVTPAKAATALLFRGFWDRTAEPGEAPEARLVLLTGRGYYAPYADDPVKADPAALARELTDADLLFPTRLRVGDRFGEAEMLKLHPPGRYSWLVESAFEFDRATVKGAGAGKVRGFRLVYRTNPDTTTLDVVPGLGVTRHAYTHHGTPAAHVLMLKEIKRP